MHMMQQLIGIRKRTCTRHALRIVDQLLQAFAQQLIVFKYRYFYFHYECRGKRPYFFINGQSPVQVILNSRFTEVPSCNSDWTLKSAYSSPARFFKVLMPLPPDSLVVSNPFPS